jgi:arylsulfatase A-like enzyme
VIVRSTIAAVLAVLSFAGSVAAQPNILLIYVDDLGYGDLGSYGHPVIETPVLDSLADEGLRLTSYYAPSALCSPSRAGLLTGRHPYRTGIRSWIPDGSGVYLRDKEITLAETLKGAGYQTAHIGKWHLNSHLGSDSEPQPTDQGFEYFYGHNAFQIPTNRNPVNIFRNGEALGMQEGYTAQLYANEAIGWLEQRDNDKPFFLYLSMAEPHTTIENPPEFNERYADYTDGEIVPIPSGLAEIPTELLVPRGPGEYYANVSYMDAQLGRVLDWLADNQLRDDTVIVFASDNGPVTTEWLQWFEVNAHGSTGGYRGRKHFLYEGGIRVPAIIRWPGMTKEGSTSDVPVNGLDLFVTLTKIGGGQVPADRAIDGIDIRTVFAGGDLPERTMVWALASLSNIEFAVRKGDWKLLFDKDQAPRELYNLADDPLEFFNLLDSEPEKLDELGRHFRSTMSSINDDPLRPDTDMTYRYAE